MFRPPSIGTQAAKTKAFPLAYNWNVCFVFSFPNKPSWESNLNPKINVLWTPMSAATLRAVKNNAFGQNPALAHLPFAHSFDTWQMSQIVPSKLLSPLRKCWKIPIFRIFKLKRKWIQFNFSSFWSERKIQMTFDGSASFRGLMGRRFMSDF